jgi:ATP adenylyltransferase/5',5'''-P-1,P-4-tetraphosphate phosphorylase II
MDALAVSSLFERQLSNWKLARENYSSLQNVKVKSIPFKGCEILVQFNPKRIISSSAKVDPQSISKRPCFLCSHNRPPQQKSIPFGDDFILLVNPYPICRQHLTIPSIQHVPQRIQGKFGIMLQLARDLPQFSIIYNGPKSGASAPDHFHFQAVQRGFLPIESDFSEKRNCLFQDEINGIAICTWNNYLRNVITISGREISAIELIFNSLYKLFSDILPRDDEPMMNILALYEPDDWIVHVFLRKQHRPRQYFESGDKQLLMSPGSIDMGGVMVMAREEDFNKITKEDIADVFKQVSIDDKVVQDLVQKLIRKL